MSVFYFNNAHSKKVVHFIAANGFPPATYKQLFGAISHVSIQSPLLRPLWDPVPPPLLKSWMDFADDLVPYVEKYQPKIVCGHSIGAVIWLLFSIKYKYSFEKLIMIDPALFPRLFYRLYPLLVKFRLQKKMHPLINVTLNRKRVFNSFDEIKNNYKKKPIFSRVVDSVLDDYINSAFKQHNNKLVLRYSPEWEAVIYETGMMKDGIVWKYLQDLAKTMEIIYIKGTLSNICTDAVTKRLKSLCPQLVSYELKGASHLLPFEQPDQVCDIIKRHLS